MVISEIYAKFQTPTKLQEHMLTVAAFGEELLKTWQGEDVDKVAIIDALLLHDIAKPMSFELTKQAQYGMTVEQIEQLRLLQERLKRDYGSDEHEATLAIAKSVGLSDNGLRILALMEWKNIPALLEQQDWEALLAIYCDLRVAPKGVVSLKERLEDYHQRAGEEGRKENLRNGERLERGLMGNLTSRSL